MIDQKWFLFRASSRAENKLDFGCRRLGVDILCPTITDFRKSGRTRRKVQITEPAFKGYKIFGCAIERPFPLKAIMDLHASIKPVLMTSKHEQTGEIKIALGRVSAKDVEQVRQNRMFNKVDAHQMIENVSADPEFETGDLVRIIGGRMAGGSLTGLTGEVKRVHTKDGLVFIEFEDGPITGATLPYEYLHLEEKDKAA